MKVLSGETLENYKSNELKYKPEWNRRYFVCDVIDYLNESTEKVLAVSGLKGTGKTIGILQACEAFDILYVLIQNDNMDNGSDVIDLLMNTDKKYIVIDQYSWIKDRDELDRYLLTSVQNGKRIILTADVSMTLEVLNYGALIHRVRVLHTNLFTYREYLDLYDYSPNKETCEKYLKEGGLFNEYALKSYKSTKSYIDDAIVDSIAFYLHDEIDKETAKILTYSVLYKAICPSNLKEPPVHKTDSTLVAFLEDAGINSSEDIDKWYLNRVADIFEQCGIIVKIPDLELDDGSFNNRYYIVNPSITCQLIKSLYKHESIDEYVLDRVYDSYTTVIMHLKNYIDCIDIYQE